jgi:sulfur-oxidizing protein SoxB
VNRSYFILALFTLSLSVNASLEFVTKPFDENLRIMSFSNIMAQVNPNYYIKKSSLLSPEGVDVLPILGDEATKVLYGESIDSNLKIGGLKYLHKLIELKRREVDHKNDLLFDIGGTLTIPFSQKNAKSLMSMHIDMSVDAMSIGREIALGKSHIEFIAKEYATTNISILSANLKDDDGFFFNAYKEYKVNGRKIVIIGYSNYKIEPTIVDKKKDNGFSSNRELENIKSMVDYFKNDTELIIVISSNSLLDNVTLAQEVPGINIILGGSDLLSLPHPYTVETDEGFTFITTAGSHGNFLSVLDLDLSGESISDYRYNLVLVDPDSLDIETSDYQFFHSESNYEPVHLATVDQRISTGYITPGLLDTYIMWLLKKYRKADLVAGSPPETDILIDSGGSITHKNIKDYFFAKNRRIVERYRKGRQIKDMIEAYYNNLDLTVGHYKPLRTMGIDYTVKKQKNGKYTVEISKIKKAKFIETKTYKILGWGDIDREDKSEEFIDDVIIELIKKIGYKRVVYDNLVKFDY